MPHCWIQYQKQAVCKLLRLSKGEGLGGWSKLQPILQSSERQLGDPPQQTSKALLIFQIQSVQFVKSHIQTSMAKSCNPCHNANNLGSWIHWKDSLWLTHTIDARDVSRIKIPARSKNAVVTLSVLNASLSQLNITLSFTLMLKLRMRNKCTLIQKTMKKRVAMKIKIISHSSLLLAFPFYTTSYILRLHGIVIFQHSCFYFSYQHTSQHTGHHV